VRIFFMGNNWLGWRALGWLREQGADVVGVALHPPDRRRHGDEMLAAADLPAERVFDASRLADPSVQRSVAALRPDIGLSVLLGYILTPAFLAVFPRGVVNLHPAFLPWNRGAHPNVWSIVERTPAGATLHWIDAGIDTGDIIAQARAPAAPEDTGETLYRKLERASLDLLQRTWPAIEAGRAPRRRQEGPGTSHRTRDVERIDEIDLDRSYRAGDLIDVLRARTFPPHRGAFFRAGGKRVYLRLGLEVEE
jgi:methionyl-tRNA formyltransferase